MKKIFTLIAMALMAVGASAQGEWRPVASQDDAPAAGATIFKDDLIKANTVYDAKVGTIQDGDGNPLTPEIGGKKFSTFFNVRVNAAPSADNPAGTQIDNATPIEITAKKNTDITIYYRRQWGSSSVQSNDGKDVKLVDQTKPTAPIAAADFSYTDIDGSYAYAMKKYALEEGKTYTLWARGTTLVVYGIDWAAGSGSTGGGGGSSVSDGTYFVSYTIDPALSTLTTEGMKNTGTANNVATWENGFSVMIMRSDKGMSAGSNITIDGNSYKSIKVSNGAQNLLTLPEGKVAKGITLYSYVNSDKDGWENSYWSEVAGIENEASTMTSCRDGSAPDVREFTFPEGTQLNKITFTNKGQQLCYVIKIDIITGSETAGVKNIKAAEVDLNAPMFNLAGQKVAEGYKGVVIQNGQKRIQK